MSPFTRFFIYAVIVADLFALIIFGGRYILTGNILSHETAEHIVVEAAKNASEETATTAKSNEPAFDYAAYVADAAKGEKVAGKCKACHTFGNGDPHRVGPNLWGTVGHPLAGHSGFAYSDAMIGKSKEIPAWNDESLFAFLENPRGYVAGTKMQFNGIKDPKDRADLIAYLKTLK